MKKAILLCIASIILFVSNPVFSQHYAVTLTGDTVVVYENAWYELSEGEHYQPPIIPQEILTKTAINKSIVQHYPVNLTMNINPQAKFNFHGNQWEVLDSKIAQFTHSFVHKSNKQIVLIITSVETEMNYALASTYAAQMGREKGTILKSFEKLEINYIPATTMQFENKFNDSLVSYTAVFDSESSFKTIVCILGPKSSKSTINSLFEKAILGISYN